MTTVARQQVAGPVTGYSVTGLLLSSIKHAWRRVTANRQVAVRGYL
jgi:hypothetical protein